MCIRDRAIKQSLKRIITSAKDTASIEGWTDLEIPQLVEGSKTSYSEEPQSISLESGETEVDLDVSGVEPGQTFKDESGYYYTTFEQDGKAYVRVSDDSYYAGTEYLLEHDPAKDVFFVTATQGTYILTPIKKGGSDAPASNKRLGGLIAN